MLWWRGKEAGGEGRGEVNRDGPERGLRVFWEDATWRESDRGKAFG